MIIGGPRGRSTRWASTCSRRARGRPSWRWTSRAARRSSSQAKTPDGAAPHRGSDEPGRHDHPSASRRLGRRRGRHHDAGGQPDRRADPRTWPTRPHASASRRPPSSQLRAVALHGAPRRPASSATTAQADAVPDARPRHSRRRRPHRPPTAAIVNWITPKLHGGVPRVRLRANPTNDPANAPKDEPLITCEADGT